MKIDLNSDLGESFGAYTMGDDAALMGIISSANVACGYHAGDPVVMDTTVRLALDRGVDLGAHVSYPDLMGFGRRVMVMDLAELEKHILYQLGALFGIAVAAGHRITHVNAHGALGNQVCADTDIADAFVRAVRSFDRAMTILVLPATAVDSAAQRQGMKTANVFLADRAYDRTGQLVSRKLPGALVKDEAAVIARVAQVLRDNTITSIEGETRRVAIQSILVHGDTPGAVTLAKAIRRTVEQAGGEVTPLSRL
jgi:5-oxoprolinase (ATP-hydrolysing) subunit A